MQERPLPHKNSQSLLSTLNILQLNGTDKGDEVYRTVSRQEMVSGIVHQPKLSSFLEHEINIISSVNCAHTLEDGLCVHQHCFFSGKSHGQNNEVHGLSLWDYKSAHSIPAGPCDKYPGHFVSDLPSVGTSNDPKVSLTKKNDYFIERKDIYASRMADVNMGYAPPKISGFSLNILFCYFLDEGITLPSDFSIAEDNHKYTGHRTLFYHGQQQERGLIGPINGKKNVFCKKLHGMWKFHCMKIKACGEPPSFCDHFDCDGWKIAKTIYLSFPYLSTEELCDQALLIMDVFESADFSFDIVVEKEQTIRSIFTDVAFCEDDDVQSWVSDCEVIFRFAADLRALETSLALGTLRDQQRGINKLQVIRLESPVAYDFAQRLKCCYTKGSVLTILHKDKLDLLQKWCPSDSFTVLKRISSSEARQRVITARSTLDQRLTAIESFKDFVKSEDWKSRINEIDALAGERKKEENKDNLEKLMNSTLKSIAQIFGNEELLWSDHNFDVLYSITKLVNRGFYVISFFKDIIRAIKMVINSEEVLLKSLDEVLGIVDGMFIGL